MKRIALLLILFLEVVNLYSQPQTAKKEMMGAHFAFGGGNYFIIGSLDGGYNTKYYYGIGVDYSRALSKRWSFCSGLEYTSFNVINKPEHPNAIPFKQNLSFVTIPVYFKYHFGKFVYFNGGISAVSDGYGVDMLLGCGMGIDFKYEFDSGFILTMSPYTKYNGILPGHQFFQAGVSLGIGKKF